MACTPAVCALDAAHDHSNAALGTYYCAVPTGGIERANHCSLCFDAETIVEARCPHAEDFNQAKLDVDSAIDISRSNDLSQLARLRLKVQVLHLGVSQEVD
jgi:hypothetical protein